MHLSACKNVAIAFLYGVWCAEGDVTVVGMGVGKRIGQEA
jgi:hypothetical protein